VLLGQNPDGGAAPWRPDFLVRADPLAAMDVKPQPEQAHCEGVDAWCLLG
jgi:hypothetical protein